MSSYWQWVTTCLKKTKTKTYPIIEPSVQSGRRECCSPHSSGLQVGLQEIAVTDPCRFSNFLRLNPPAPTPAMLSEHKRRRLPGDLGVSRLWMPRGTEVNWSEDPNCSNTRLHLGSQRKEIPVLRGYSQTNSMSIWSQNREFLEAAAATVSVPALRVKPWGSQVSQPVEGTWRLASGVGTAERKAERHLFTNLLS